MLIKIKPVTLTPGNVQPSVVADFANVENACINFAGGTASGLVDLGTCNEAGEFVRLQGAGATVAMTPEQYAQWGTDDDYAVDCFLANLNLVKA